jgi:hypothetical protein
MWNHRRLMCLTLLTLLASCNSGPKTVGLEGDVSYDGRPIENGRIDLVPIDGTPGASAGASISAGRYEVPAAFGVRPDGVYQVRIIGLRKTGKTGMSRSDASGAQSIELQENFIPAVYNAQSTMKLNVSELADKKKTSFQLRRYP